MKIGAVITAAGMATRMHEFKQLMKIGGIPMAERAIRNFRAAGVDPILVVTGYRAQELEEELKGTGVRFLRNPAYETTDMFESAKLGLKEIQNSCDRVFFCPADIPMFTENTVGRLMEETAPLVMPVSAGRTGHPILMDRSLIPQILGYRGEGGLKGALAALTVEPVYVPVRDPGTLADADTQEEFCKLTEMIAGKG